MMSLWPALVNTLAVLATVAVVSTGGTRWAPAAFLVPLVIILWRQRRTVLRVPRGVGGLGRYITARFILIAAAGAQIDRKSTRLNSSHVAISYAVFCLKKKRTSTINRRPATH